ncbi:BLOC-1-related complex subunit 5 [Ischnura elegans]|uniref:BLOC-1-related complex subunit 5 n=1 Tax=Ischnura elegans TaxID=197161 RepID=UPI001ED896EC|nr:BLOC-1-related complex subunit 5 [Ischnura elegans]XP_046384368.1 BLOC-1-related complex subunit 5 [Ischnura elegans]XP_046384369.1 BLOC-1-related complex subunit 5 [Ischnura elegans]
MGSEQSSQQQHIGRQQRINQQRNTALGRSRSRDAESREDEGPTGSGSEFARPGSISPGPSICSDSDLPYISYTVNRPIGDSPKLPHKHLQGHGSRGKFVGQSSRKALSRKTALVRSNITSGHNIVVVKPAVNTEPVEKDPDLVRLQSVPMFLPIMRGTLNLPAARDPEVLERLDPTGLLALCHRYQQHIAISAQVVASEQALLTVRVREVDAAISAMIDRLVERQRKFARYAERLAKVHDVSHQLNRCHVLLNQTLESLDSLNNSLPVAERLEPFVWTTG